MRNPIYKIRSTMISGSGTGNGNAFPALLTRLAVLNNNLKAPTTTIAIISSDSINGLEGATAILVGIRYPDRFLYILPRALCASRIMPWQTDEMVTKVVEEGVKLLETTSDPQP